jgi:hypothetical protein
MFADKAKAGAATRGFLVELHLHSGKKLPSKLAKGRPYKLIRLTEEEVTRTRAGDKDGLIEIVRGALPATLTAADKITFGVFQGRVKQKVASSSEILLGVANARRLMTQPAPHT